MIACLACSHGLRSLTREEQQRIKDLNNQRPMASPQEQRLIECQIRSIEAAGGALAASECIFKYEYEREAPFISPDKQRTDAVIDRNLRDALER
jgi:hypothetical protein